MKGNLYPKVFVNKIWDKCFKGVVAQRKIVINEADVENGIGMKVNQLEERNMWSIRG